MLVMLQLIHKDRQDIKTAMKASPTYMYLIHHHASHFKSLACNAAAFHLLDRLRQMMTSLPLVEEAPMCSQ